MRAGDTTLPPIVLHSDPSLLHWPLRPVVAIGGKQTVQVWDDPALTYEDAAVQWDIDTVVSYTDATCDFQGIEIDTGNPDEHLNFAAAQATIQLANADGQWSRYNTDGTQANGPGYPLAVWAINNTDGTQHWLFNGMISRWDDLTGDGTVSVEAFDIEAALARPIGTFTVGLASDRPGVRIQKIMTAAGLANASQRLALGTVTLTVQATDASPLEEIQAVTSSDGGVIFGDADGALMSLSRQWRTQGRAPAYPQPSAWVASDNVCTSDLLQVWNAVLTTNDDTQADVVILQNVAHVKAQYPPTIAGVAYSESDHQWTTQAEGDAVANIIWASQSGASVKVDQFEVYAYDTRQPLAAHTVEWRLLDTLRFLHDTKVIGGTFVRLDLNTLIKTINHDITPDQWIITVETTRAMGTNAVLVWNPPGDSYVWDAANAVWGF